MNTVDTKADPGVTVHAPQRAHTHAHTCTHTRTHVHAHVHTRTCAHTCTHTHVPGKGVQMPAGKTRRFTQGPRRGPRMQYLQALGIHDPLNLEKEEGLNSVMLVGKGRGWRRP